MRLTIEMDLEARGSGVLLARMSARKVISQDDLKLRENVERGT